MAEIEVDRERDEVVLEHTGFRLSWGGIFAGFIAATMVHLTLSLFGIALGFANWDVSSPTSGLGGVGIWVAVSALIAYYVGGLTTGRLSGVLTRGDGALHGLIMWGVSMIANIILLAGGAGVVLGGVFGLVQQTVAATAGGVAQGVGAAGGAAIGSLGDLDLGALQGEVETALEQTGVGAVQVDTLQRDVGRIRGAAAAGASNEQLARDIVDLVRQRAGAVDREAVINLVVARTGMARAEAEQVATRVESAAAGAREAVGSAAEDVGAAAEDVATTAADALATAAWWTLLALGLSLAAAAWGAAQKARE